MTTHTEKPHKITYLLLIMLYRYLLLQYGCCLKKNQNAPRPSEHPPVMGGKMSKRLGGIKGCKYKTSSWHLNRFPDADNIGSAVCCFSHSAFCWLTTTTRKNYYTSTLRGDQSRSRSAKQGKDKTSGSAPPPLQLQWCGTAVSIL